MTKLTVTLIRNAGTATRRAPISQNNSGPGRRRQPESVLREHEWHMYTLETLWAANGRLYTWLAMFARRLAHRSAAAARQQQQPAGSTQGARRSQEEELVGQLQVVLLVQRLAH